MIKKWLYTFSKILGNGRAWALKDNTTRKILESLLCINEEVRQMFEKIPKQSIPAYCDESVIPLWERHYDIIPKVTQTMLERREICMSRWLGTGGGSPSYIEQVMKAAGFNVKITMNSAGAETYEELILSDGLPLNLSDGTTLLMTSRQSEPLDYFEVFGDGYALGSGKIKLEGEDWVDTALPPANEKERRAYFLVEGSDGYIFFHTVENRETFEKTLVRYKPAHTIAYVRGMLGGNGLPFSYACYNPIDDTFTPNLSGLGFAKLEQENFLLSDGSEFIMSDGSTLEFINNEIYGDITESGQWTSSIEVGV